MEYSDLDRLVGKRVVVSVNKSVCALEFSVAGILKRAERRGQTVYEVWVLHDENYGAAVFRARDVSSIKPLTMPTRGVVTHFIYLRNTSNEATDK